jgi:hypothetical protein
MSREFYVEAQKIKETRGVRTYADTITTKSRTIGGAASFYYPVGHPGLFHQNHFLCIREISGIQPVEVDSRRKR